MIYSSIFKLDLIVPTNSNLIEIAISGKVGYLNAALLLRWTKNYDF